MPHALKNPKTLILVRHAHRDTDAGRRLDNGLSERGHAQATQIEKLFLSRYPEIVKPVLLSSPSKRCRETLEPIAKSRKVPVKIDRELGEQTGDESGRDFQKRIGKFIDGFLGRDHELEVCCSHGDWIPICLELLAIGAIDLKKGGWAEIRWKKKAPVLWHLRQEIIC